MAQFHQTDNTLELWDIFLSDKEEQTKKDYFSVLKKFSQHVGQDILTATQLQCSDYLNTLQTKYSTAYKHYSILSSFYRFLADHKYIIQNPLKNISFEAPKQTIDRIISRGELKTLITYLEQSDLLCLSAVLLSVKTLLTSSEICNLKRTDIDIDHRFIKTKTKYKTIYNRLTEDMIPYLTSYISTVDSGSSILFPSSRTPLKPITTKTLFNRLQSGCKECGIDHYNFNELRNTGIAAAAFANAPTRLISGAVDMKTSIHVNRLTDLSGVPNEVAEYIHI